MSAMQGRLMVEQPEPRVRARSLLSLQLSSLALHTPRAAASLGALPTTKPGLHHDHHEGGLHRQLARVAKDDEHPVRVVVSGSVFTTTATTLTTREPNSVFADRLRASSSPPTTELHFDRNPRLFLVVLNYLRTGAIAAEIVARRDAAELRPILAEARFYACQGLANKLYALLTPTPPRFAINPPAEPEPKPQPQSKQGHAKHQDAACATDLGEEDLMFEMVL